MAIYLYRIPLFTTTQNFALGFKNLFYFSQSTVSEYTFVSDSLGKITKSGYIYLPAAYKTNTTEKFPVLYLLHGDPGSSKDWVQNGNIRQIADQLIKSGEMQPVIIVMPDGNGPIIKNAQYLNADVAQQKMEDYIVRDVITYIDSHYRTLAQKNMRAIGGSSSGGYGALNISFHHPDLFSVVFGLSAYIEPIGDEVSQLLTASSVEKNKLINVVNELDPKITPLIFLYYGEHDMFNFNQDNELLHKKLTERKIPVEVLADDNGHDWLTWQNAIPQALIFTSKQFSSFSMNSQ